MILVAGGDSFIYGAELADQITQPSLSTYPALLASQYGMSYNCVACPGSANNAISRTVMGECQRLLSTNEKFVVSITWTFSQRYEFRFNYNTCNRNSPWYSINSWDVDTAFINKELIRTTNIVEFINMYYKHVGNSEYNEVYLSLKEIVFMQNYLKVNNIPYIFSTADCSIFNQVDNKDRWVLDLHNQIDWDSWYLFPAGTEANESVTPRGFYQWAVENKYNMGINYHPLEDAHKDAAILIKDKFNELVNKNN